MSKYTVQGEEFPAPPPMDTDNYKRITTMGNMKTFWIFGFERWGGLRPAEMRTAKGERFVPLFWGLWIRKK